MFMHSALRSSQIWIKLENPQQIKKKYIRVPNFIKIRPVGGDLLHADGQTDMTKQNSRFSRFCERV